MSGLFKQYKTNSAKEVEGVKVEFLEAQNDDGTIPTFIIARTGSSNKAYSKAVENATRPYRRQIELKTLKNEVAEKLMLPVFVDTVLKGWQNVQNESGERIEYSRDAAIKLMEDLPDVYQRLQEEAGTLSNFLEQAVEEEAKN